MAALTLKGFATVARRNVCSCLRRRKLTDDHCSMVVVVRKHKPFAYWLESRKIAPALGN